MKHGLGGRANKGGSPTKDEGESPPANAHPKENEEATWAEIGGTEDDFFWSQWDFVKRVGMI